MTKLDAAMKAALILWLYRIDLGWLRRLVLVLGLLVMVMLVFAVLRSPSSSDHAIVDIERPDRPDLYDNLTRPFHSVVKTRTMGAYERSFVTVVTQYFKLEHSKHSHDKYKLWIRTFFQSITKTPVVVFTDLESSAELIDIAMEMSSSSKTFFIVDNIWSIVKQLEVDRDRSYLQNYQKAQARLDPEGGIHTANLYAIWNSKSFMVNHSASQNIYKSKFFIYSDIGAFRDQAYAEWPDVAFVRRLHAQIGDKALLGQIGSSRLDNPYSSLSNFVEGGFFAGSPEAIRTFSFQFYEIHDELYDRGFFVGKDQTIMNYLAKIRYRDSVVRLKSPFLFLVCLKGENQWFFYQYYLSRLAPDDKCIGNKNRLSREFLSV